MEILLRSLLNMTSGIVALNSSRILFCVLLYSLYPSHDSNNESLKMYFSFYKIYVLFKKPKSHVHIFLKEIILPKVKK